MKIEKIDFFSKNSKKFVYYNEELVTNSKFQTQLSRKLQRIRTCRKNKKCSIFHDLSEYIIFHMIVTYWTGPLRNDISKLQTESGRSKKAPKYFKTYHTPVFGVEKHEFEVRFLIRLNHTEIRGYALQNIG